MGTDDLNQYLEKIKTDDAELIAKLVLLGGKEREIQNVVQKMISEELEPSLSQVARILKEGKNGLNNMFKFKIKWLKIDYAKISF